MVRHVDTTSASVWVETAEAARVVVHADERSWSARTFAVHGHHYTLVEIDGLEPGTVAPYTVEIDGTTVWPEPGSDLPTSCLTTLKPDKPLRLAFGSCRTSVGHDEEGNKTHGVDAMRAYALKMASDDDLRWPDLVLFLGDQVYADETTKEMCDFLEARRDTSQPPWTELKDYEEYAHLYKLAWSDPVNRWLLSTLPSSMIFDDHDIRDDWNTSAVWREEMEATSWWQDRIVGGLASYWVYQHLGNLTPQERAKDEIWRQVQAAKDDDAELDLTETLDAFAERVDAQPDSYRWSYARDLGRSRLVVVDSRAARVLDNHERSILDEAEMGWLDEQMQGGFEHLFIGTSLPFLLSSGLHHLEAFSEALVAGGWGDRAARKGEKLRQAVDLEHWAAFQEGFQKVATMAMEVADGKRGPAPTTVTFLSGDVHHSYVSEVVERPGGRILQAVCSPIRNPLPRYMRFATAVLSYGLAGPMGAVASRSKKVPDVPFRWKSVEGPWFDNNLATLEVVDGGLKMWWDTGVVHDGQQDRPDLRRVATVSVDPDGCRIEQRGPEEGKLNRASNLLARVRGRARRSQRAR